MELLGIYARMDFASLTRDTKFMAIAIAADLISNLSSISGIFLLAWKFGGIGGMGRFEVLFMLAYGNIVMGFLNMMGGCNALFPSRIIGRGQWEHMAFALLLSLIATYCFKKGFQYYVKKGINRYVSGGHRC